MSLVSAQGLTVSLGGQLVLDKIDFSINPAEIVTIVGPNGSGKTTLLRALIGAVKASGGQIDRKSGLRIGYVPQKLHIDMTLPLTVSRFLDLPARQNRDEIAWALSAVGANGLEGRQMVELSGGQFQRVLLARAVLGRPELLLLDEPAQGLDQPGAAAFYSLVDEVRREVGCAILMVSHDLHVVMSGSDRVICLNGHICCQGTPSVVSSAPEYRALFGAGTGGALALYQHQHDHSHDQRNGQADKQAAE
ncbi:MAG: metal ABC transporter ATP-binding protein [Pseudomonadota bacterium]